MHRNFLRNSNSLFSHEAVTRQSRIIAKEVTNLIPSDFKPIFFVVRLVHSFEGTFSNQLTPKPLVAKRLQPI